MSEGKMRRVMIQVPVELYEECRLEAHKRSTSISAVAREALQENIGAGDQDRVVVRVALDLDVYKDLDETLARNGNTAEAMLEKHVQRYIEAFKEQA